MKILSLEFLLNRCLVLHALLLLVGVSSLLVAVLSSETSLLRVVTERTSELASEGAVLLAKSRSMNGALIVGLVVLLAELGADSLRKEPEEE
jgi:hypothetical protein